MKQIYFAGGCFWGTEHYMESFEGVLETEAGYANGDLADPTYEQVYTEIVPQSHYPWHGRPPVCKPPLAAQRY